ncbi:hypothetical protein SNE40_010674 [Patella caerulea]|uniref:Uncharacterized protein n=1 Tax=Patella caerulea TaxID=87958 RepID=A0AAN8JUT0_PATCE
MGGKKEDTPPIKDQRRPLSIIVESDSSDDEKKGHIIKPQRFDKQEAFKKPRNIQNTIPRIEITEAPAQFVEKNNNVKVNGDQDDDDDDILNESDLQLLKQVTTRLNLSTRRQSYTAWKSENIDRSPRSMRADKPKLSMDGHDNKLTDERKQRIDDALEWLRKELHDMRVQDQELARQFLTLKHDIQQVKLTKSCEEHQDMLEEVQCELEELEDLPDVLDLPAYGLSDNPLKHLGVTRMNIHSRRFSTC